MMNRMLIALTFVAALIAASTGVASKAEAHGYRRSCHRDYDYGYDGHYGYRSAYRRIDLGYYPVYRTYFGPRYPYSTAFDRPYYGHGGYGRSGVSFSVGF